MNYLAAVDYAEKHGLEALLIERAGQTLFECYATGFDAQTPHALYSGTKSFWGVAAVAAEHDALLDLEEPVGATFETWTHGAKGRVTLRHLLQLTSGIGFGGLGRAVPLYATALDVALKSEPGERFTYGGIPLQVFGAVLACKLRATGRTPHSYLRERLLEPIGLEIGSWRALKDGTEPLPTGAFVAAAQWAKFGRLVLQHGAWDGASLVPPPALAKCFEGSAANPRYGLAWWLSPLASAPELAYASGSGGQAMYLIPAHDAVVVKFGKSASYGHEPFLKRLLS